MNKSRLITALALAALLLIGLALSAPAALAAGEIGQPGNTAAQLGDNLFISIKNNDGAGLNVVPLTGGELTRVDTSTTIGDLVVVGNDMFYLRTDPPVTQLIKTSGDGSALEPLCEWNSAEVSSLSYYNDMLYCLVDGLLMMIDPSNGESDELNVDVLMSEYAISNDVVYYVSKTDIADYSMPTGGKTATGSSGKLYIMHLFPTAGSTGPQCILDQGVSHLQLMGNYLYLHNLDDGYPTESREGDVWIEGKLYRMNLETTQLVSMNIPYDWTYVATESGLLVHASEDVSLYPLTGGAAKLLMAPEVVSSVTADATNAYVFEHSKGVLTMLPLVGGGSTELYSGGPIDDLVPDTDRTMQQVFDENGDPVLDEDGNPVYEQSDDEVAEDDDTAYHPEEESTTTSSGGKDSSYIFKNSKTKKLTRSQILDTSKSYWRRARNEIYARHGYEFKDAELRKYFNGKSWYKPGGFSTSKLNSTEWYNMELILSMEKEYGLIDDKDGSGSSGSSSSTGRIKLSKNVFASSSTKKLTRSQLKGLSANKLATARNEILARHGYPFQQSKWKKYFAGTGWKARSNYSYSQLNSIENYNIKLIKEYE